MVLWNLLDGGPSRSGPLIGYFESIWGGTLGTKSSSVTPECLASE
jgi:hypothetical protein